MTNNIKLENQNNKNNGWLFALYTIITMCIYILPALKLRIPYIFAGLLMLISLVIIALQDKEMFKYSAVLIISSFYFFLLYLIRNMTITDSINEMIRNIRFFIPVMWTIYAFERLNRKHIKMILICFLVMATYILYNTLTALGENPEIARLLAQGTASESGAELNSYRLSNIGGFEFSYMMGIVSLIVMWMFLIQKKVWVKIVLLACYVLIFNYILQSQYATLLFLTFAGTVILLFLFNKNIVLRLFLVLFSLVLIFNITDIAFYLSNLFKGSVLERKFLQIANALVKGTTEELGSRPELIINSFNAWLKNPIFGLDARELNSHSLIMGTLASGGLIGIALFVCLYIISLKLIHATINEYKQGISLFICSSIFLIALSFFNPIGYVFEMTIATFFLVPICIKYFS